MSSSWTRERSKIGVIAREIKRGERPADDPALDEAKRGLAAARLEAYIEKVLASAPPLSDEQRCKLAELLRPARQSIAAARLAGIDTGGAA